MATDDPLRQNDTTTRVARLDAHYLAVVSPNLSPAPTQKGRHRARWRSPKRPQEQAELRQETFAGIKNVKEGGGADALPFQSHSAAPLNHL